LVLFTLTKLTINFKLTIKLNDYFTNFYFCEALMK
jgi:hypothetical protein